MTLPTEARIKERLGWIDNVFLKIHEENELYRVEMIDLDTKRRIVSIFKKDEPIGNVIVVSDETI